jgi:transcription elongation factor Elf1
VLTTDAVGTAKRVVLSQSALMGQFLAQGKIISKAFPLWDQIARSRFKQRLIDSVTLSLAEVAKFAAKGKMNCKICSVETNTELCDMCKAWVTAVAVYNKGWHWDTLHIAIINHRFFRVYDPAADVVGDWPNHTHIVKFNDDLVITTNKIVHEGEIPFRFRKQLPTNATFLNQRQRCMVCERRFVPTLSDEICFHCAVNEGGHI